MLGSWQGRRRPHGHAAPFSSPVVLFSLDQKLTRTPFSVSGSQERASEIFAPVTDEELATADHDLSSTRPSSS